MIIGMAALALSAGAVGIAQAVGGESDGKATGPQADRAAHAALAVVDRGRVVAVRHDNKGVAAWEVQVFKPMQHVEAFSKGPMEGAHIVVRLDRDFNWIEAKVEGYGPPEAN